MYYEAFIKTRNLLINREIKNVYSERCYERCDTQNYFLNIKKTYIKKIVTTVTEITESREILF